MSTFMSIDDRVFPAVTFPENSSSVFTPVCSRALATLLIWQTVASHQLFHIDEMTFEYK